jgi:hypothetical protein
MPTFNTTDPKPGYVYDAGDDTWYPLAGIATQTLDGLTDVVITSASTNQVLAYNGTNWVNSAEAGDIASVTAGTGLSGGGSTGALTLSIDTGTTADLSTAQTLTNKTISAASNTLTGVATLTGTETLTNKTLTAPTLNDSTQNYSTLKSTTETINIVASAATGTINIDKETSTVWYYTTNATANHTLNFRYNSGTTLNSKLSIGETATFIWINTNGATPYYPSAITIDGNAVTPKFSGGTAYTAGNASSIDMYQYSIIKTANATFTVFAAQVKYA